LYVPKLSEAVLAEVARVAALGGRLVVYSWQPGQIKQRVNAPNVAFEKIPEFLVSRFGGAK
jgi:adenine-specific DNA-methyltransferase